MKDETNKDTKFTKLMHPIHLCGNENETVSVAGQKLATNLKVSM